MNADTFIKEFEKMTGEKASEAVHRFVNDLFDIESRFETRGREDRAKGLPLPGVDAFIHWANKVFNDDPELAETIAELMQMAYEHGYKKGVAL